MKHMLKLNAVKWFIVVVLVLLSSVASAGNAPKIDPTETEKYWLSFMREEEKLARDVYIVLYQQWGSRIFNNIAKSEQTHMDAIKTLLDRYGIADPASTELGEFNNETLRYLFQTLVDQGKESLTAALQVGETIENKDIGDLNEAISLTQRKDIKTVYNNLLQGSLNHLKAFVSNLAIQGIVYEQ